MVKPLVMKRLFSLLSCLLIGTAAIALTPQQVEQLQEAKKQFEAGLISQPIYEEMQRKILDLPNSSPKPEAAAQPVIDPLKSKVLTKLTTGYWRLTSFYGSEAPANGPVHRFLYSNGQLSIFRHKSNYADEPGRAEVLPVKELVIKDNYVGFRYLKRPQDPNSESVLEIELNEQGEFKVSGDMGPPFHYILTSAPVFTNDGWNTYRLKNDAQDIIKLLGPVSEIWRSNGDPDHETSGDGFLVWYNAVEVPRHYLDDYSMTLRPLILKLKVIDNRLAIKECFDYMTDSWVEFPQHSRERKYVEVYVDGFADGTFSQAQWNDFVKRMREDDRQKGRRPKSEIPLKEGGIRRGKSPHVSPPDENS